ncbi:MAG: hypothetical protein COA96_03640 [SAR86 cluster bacterium]|uniref:Uncharacterized protein n=1 Tax=SAR86 cluster bacterium TaxID=2030880 RepID=A0A2A5B6Y0_9GAMM|nr:MAG: hypothetical protein COA96_03640 [SAR86 cluster bacterium]
MISSDTKYQGNVLLWLSITAFIGLILIQQLVAVTPDSQMTIAFHNAAHTPWFLCLTLLIWPILKQVTGREFWQLLIVCGLFALILGIFLELVQVFTSRQASWGDVGLNYFGAISALCFIAMVHEWRNFHRGAALFLLVVAISLVLMGFRGVGSIYWLHLKRDSISPVLLAFDGPSAITRRNLGADWEIVIGPSPWTDFAGKSVAKVTLQTNLRWPGITLAEPYPAWDEYFSLHIHAFLDSDDPIPLTVRVETFENRGMDSTVDVSLLRGANYLTIPISQLIPASGKTNLDVKALYIFSEGSQAGRNFYLGAIKLSD